ncbi:MAG: homoaconitate hydratase [Candidatus Bathyarchaeia archaeon]
MSDNRTNIPKYITSIADGLVDTERRRWLNMVEEGVVMSPYDIGVIKRRKTDELIVHDTTLREGEQTPGVTMSAEGKIKIGMELDRAGIQQIEAGFPAASEKQFTVVKRLANEGLNAEIFGFARAVKSDIETVATTDAYGVVLSYSVSPIMRELKFHISEEEYLNRLSGSIEHARDHGLFIVYSAEDSTRTPLGFLRRAFLAAKEAGMDRARIVDTLGCIIPEAMTRLVKEIKKAVDKPVEVHCHNDLGLALSNSFAAINAGGSTVSSSIHGLGERAGITPTEEMMVILRLFYGVKRFRIERLPALSKLVADITGLPIFPLKPILGNNIFMHKAGIHAHGMFKDPRTYEMFSPEIVGKKREFVLSELCGKYSVKHVARSELNIDVPDGVAAKIAARIKMLYTQGRVSPILPSELREMIRRA